MIDRLIDVYRIATKCEGMSGREVFWVDILSLLSDYRLFILISPLRFHLSIFISIGGKPWKWIFRSKHVSTDVLRLSPPLVSL